MNLTDKENPTPHQALFFVGGCNSYVDPMLLSQTSYKWGVNVVNRGGVIQTRPGFELLFEIPGFLPQGITAFKEFGKQNSKLVFAVDGQIYQADPAPGGTYTKLDNAEFDPLVRRIYWCNTLKSLTYDGDGNIVRVEPKTILMIQDGINRAGGWDGTTNSVRRYDPLLKETAIGTAMALSASRLFIARGQYVYAMDLLNPEANEEQTYLAETGAFYFGDDVTGLAVTPDQSRLMVFTRNTTYSLNATERDRSKWQLLPEFQRLEYPQIGCVSHQSIATHFGTLWWYSVHGMQNLNDAATTYHNSELRYSDNEMIRSKAYLSPNTECISTGVLENYMLVAVPYRDIWNAHQWVMDQSSADFLHNDVPSNWNGVWTGIRPVEYAKCQVNGRDELYCISKDYDNVIRIWRLMADRYDDNGKKIYWRWETREHGNGFNQVQFNMANIHCVEARGDWCWQAYVGSANRPYTPIGLTGGRAMPCSAQSVTDADCSLPDCEDSKPYYYRLRTAKPNIQCSSCSLDPKGEQGQSLVDVGFSLAFDGYGQIGFRGYKINLNNEYENVNQGAMCSASKPLPAINCRQELAIPTRKAFQPVTPNVVDRFYSSVPLPSEVPCIDCPNALTTTD